MRGAAEEAGPVGDGSSTGLCRLALWLGIIAIASVFVSAALDAPYATLGIAGVGTVIAVCAVRKSGWKPAIIVGFVLSVACTVLFGLITVAWGLRGGESRTQMPAFSPASAATASKTDRESPGAVTAAPSVSAAVKAASASADDASGSDFRELAQTVAPNANKLLQEAFAEYLSRWNTLISDTLVDVPENEADLLAGILVTEVNAHGIARAVEAPSRASAAPDASRLLTVRFCFGDLQAEPYAMFETGFPFDENEAGITSGVWAEKCAALNVSAGEVQAASVDALNCYLQAVSLCTDEEAADVIRTLLSGDESSVEVNGWTYSCHWFDAESHETDAASASSFLLYVSHTALYQTAGSGSTD